ncbi:MAG: hypothetical protein QXN23_07110 [Candidatus Caldarchaeum sp.]|uniref:Uncharacterized protein n=1 Tax=Caldiarchaeum subterraneum TaxID=311458 RepID=A0A7C4I8G9_CALS0
MASVKVPHRVKDKMKEYEDVEIRRSIINKLEELERERAVKEAIKVAMNRGITVYDAVFMRLMTADDGQARAASEEGVEVRLVEAKR